MTKTIIYLVTVLLSLTIKIYGQDTKPLFEDSAKKIALEIEKISKEEKETLKAQVETVNIELEKGLITKEQADSKKKELATKSANTISEKISVEEEKLSQLIKDKIEGKITTKKDEYKVSIFNKSKDTIPKSEKRTTSQFVIATGFNNVITNGSIANSDYGYLRSGFFEWGITHNTRILKENNLLHFKYGLTFVYNYLSPTQNRALQVEQNKTVLTEYPIPLTNNQSYFKNVFLTLPMHLEFDFTETKNINGKQIFKSHKALRIGIGGFLGYNTNSKQFLKYNVNGYKIKEVQKGGWNVNDWNYGMSAYMGWKETSLYIKYDLNPIFEHNDIKQNNISLGLRFDFN